MICDKCKKNNATTIYKQTINGNTTVMHLCSECAAKYGGFNFPANFFGTDDLFSQLLFPAYVKNSPDTSKRCPSCGKSFDEIISSGKVGCSNCYLTFENELSPSISKIHGNAEHSGKLPKGAGEKAQKAHKLDSLKKQLQQAIQNEEFEQAAKIRDQIKAMEGNNTE